MASNPLRVRYDRASDVLYINTARSGPAYGEEDAPGLIWRYLDEDGSLVGLTVIDYSAYWVPRFAELVEQLTAHFHVPELNAQRVLSSVNA